MAAASTASVAVSKIMLKGSPDPFILSLGSAFTDSMKIGSENILIDSKPNKYEIKYGRELRLPKNGLANRSASTDYDLTLPENQSGYNHILEIKAIFGLSGATLPVFKTTQTSKDKNNTSMNDEIEDDLMISSFCEKWPRLFNDTTETSYVVQLFGIHTTVLCNIVLYIASFYQEAYLYRPSIRDPFSAIKYLVLLNKRVGGRPVIELPNIPSKSYLARFDLVEIDPESDKVTTPSTDVFKIMNRKITRDFYMAMNKQSVSSNNKQQNQKNQQDWYHWIDTLKDPQVQNRTLLEILQNGRIFASADSKKLDKLLAA